ncbi:MAG: hypothetical protein Q7S58_21310 [Candidatus Binatus sp.]|uniref:hypothetical protein n=1 Tax=Candidatus Binatus sp. TaxID=2811406 RepID=UPI00271874E0|nr:hypothetical protein [Candidatus Binatus sp.]MDO8434946.1 hypothetical protein [Candidatus Binatus sp.]
MELMMNKVLLVLVLIAIAPISSAWSAGPDFIVCKSTYALCTTAECSPIADKPGFVSCNCNVTTGYSAGLRACEEKNASEGRSLKSRYHPINSYARCSNDRPWGWCLDSPCVVDNSDPSKAACACSVVKNQGDYVIVNDTGSYNESSCTTGLYSSATVVQLDQVTDFLKTHDTPLHPVPMKIYTGK